MPTKVYQRRIVNTQEKGLFQKIGLKSKKAWVALALAVSLWIGGGGTVSANDLYIDADNGDKVKEVGGNISGRLTPGVYQTATDKKLTVTGGNWDRWYIYGGKSNVDISDYTLILDETVDVYYAYGGYSGSGNAAGNILELKDSFIIYDVYGGMVASGTGNATGNKVTVTNSTVGDSGIVFGGYSQNGDATGNIVELKDSTVNYCVKGGWSMNGQATGNRVDITGGTIGTISPDLGVDGGQTTSGKAEGNYVTIFSGTINNNIRGGATTSGTADKNIVTISGGTINGNVYGGYSQSGTANKNIVTISGGTFGANTYIYGGQGGPSQKATNNTVNILKQIGVGGLIGGSTVVVSNSTGNTLNLAAKGVTTGVLDRFQNLNFYLPTDMSKTDIMLTVSDNADVRGAKVGVMAQGKLTNLVKNDKVTLLHANTLNGTVSQTTEIEVPESIATVDTYEFNVISDTNNIYATITKEPEESSDNGGDNGNSENGNGGNNNGGNNNNGGDNGNSNNGGGNDSNNNKHHEDTKSIAETKAATTTFINAGADMLASQGFEQAANAVALETAAQSKSGGAGVPSVSSFTPFAAMGGSSMRAESGSYVDTKGFGLNLGFAREIANGNGKLLFGPVVEYGGGSYDSYLDNGTHGEGGSHYFGVGIMARQVNQDGFYYEGSLRGGRVTSDYKSSFIMKNNAPNNINYDTASNYLAAHVGVGKIYDMGHGDTLDGYFKYFYSHQAGDNVTIHATSGDEQWSFDAVNSHRIRIGARLTHKVNEKNSYYGGLAYQYEFGGDAMAHYNGGSTPSPSVKGSSGMLELGWQVKPGNGPLTLDLGLNGWVGKQRGGSVQLGATWSF